jgi:hypothetical protein
MDTLWSLLGLLGVLLLVIGYVLWRTRPERVVPGTEDPEAPFEEEEEDREEAPAGGFVAAAPPPAPQSAPANRPIWPEPVWEPPAASGSRAVGFDETSGLGFDARPDESAHDPDHDPDGSSDPEPNPPSEPRGGG